MSFAVTQVWTLFIVRTQLGSGWVACRRPRRHEHAHEDEGMPPVGDIMKANSLFTKPFCHLMQSPRKPQEQIRFYETSPKGAT